ncbi:RDD family protein [Brevundimonas sp.]|uniref:RDD family protein n=1 Tax=Brevundimonas sp. TaxID=1871086 RepID=UPI001823AFFC|nr:RDD family protein [Brevundimonas sp.]MBA3050650.1 RDD family protein [Brevundimonas sp.]
MTAVDITADARKRQRSLITPEGIDLRLEIASVGQRLAALIIDMMIIIGVIVLFTLAAGFVFGSMTRAGEMIAVIWLLGLFLLRNGYFLAFEMSARAATPGKRVMGLRVAARDGGRLRFEAIFTRNVLRELELFLPLSAMLAAPLSGGGGDVDGWIYVLGLIWCAVFVFLPLFNADKLRAGDLVAGTWVLRTPKQKLLRDMADDNAAHQPNLAFTPAQLDAYGIKELQVLEQVLRTRDKPTVRAVADRIAGKIEFTRGDVTDLEFLRAYYHAVRGRLESRLLMGRRRKDKFDLS